MTIPGKLIPAIIIGCFLTLIITACESREQKTDDAFDRVKKEKMSFNDSNSVDRAMLQEQNKVEIFKATKKLDEWVVFKIEMEKKLLTNENKIEKIKGIPNTGNKLSRKITSLETANRDLRIQMDEYKKETKAKWESFRAKINQDVDKIDIELKDIILNDK